MEDICQSVLVKDYETLIKYIKNPRYEVKDLFRVSDDMLMINYREVKELCKILPHQNIVIAAFTTAQARVHLYEKMETLHYNQLLYTGKKRSCMHKKRRHLSFFKSKLQILTA